jgi:hypothetical protein
MGRAARMATSSLHLTMECRDAQPNDLSRSLVALDQNSTIIAVIEISSVPVFPPFSRADFGFLERHPIYEPAERR